MRHVSQPAAQTERGLHGIDRCHGFVERNLNTERYTTDVIQGGLKSMYRIVHDVKPALRFV
jgi:hypothetical protein